MSPTLLGCFLAMGTLWQVRLVFHFECLATVFVFIMAFIFRMNLITVTSQWAWWRLKSQAPRLFVQPLFNQIKEGITILRHWPFWGDSGDQWIPITKGQYRGKWFPFDDVIVCLSGTSRYHVILLLTDVLCDQRDKLPGIVVTKSDGDLLEYSMFVGLSILTQLSALEIMMDYCTIWNGVLLGPLNRIVKCVCISRSYNGLLRACMWFLCCWVWCRMDCNGGCSFVGWVVCGHWFGWRLDSIGPCLGATQTLGMRKWQLKPALLGNQLWNSGEPNFDI